MASGTRLRDAGQRKPALARSKLGEGVIANSLGVTTGGSAEHRLNLAQVYALEHMFQGNPAVQAARTVLSGQLLSGGISLRKNGTDVELQPAFRDHLNEVWLPFAQDVIDCFLKWGMVVISYEEHEDDLRRASLLSKRRKVEPAVPRGKSASRAAKAVQQTPTEPPVIVPIVPMLGSYEIAYRMGGRAGYKREYMVYTTNPTTGTRVDEEARVVVKQHPDQVGNVNSPLASVFELGSFVAAIMELAVVAESSRARPRMVTQMRKKDASALDPGNLFFDSESRAVQAGADADESAGQARALQLQQQMCAMINRLQTKHYGPDHDMHSFGGGGGSKITGKLPYAPPEVAPTLFTLPKEQELAPNMSNPESRGDLEALTRLSIEQFSAAFGVPSDLIFSGRFAGKSTSQYVPHHSNPYPMPCSRSAHAREQASWKRCTCIDQSACFARRLSLLNITVSQLAKAVNSVLTIAYRDIYSEGPSDDVGQLQLLTSPLAATDEVLNLFNGGLVPVEIAMPSVLHAIGATKDDIDAALEKAKQREDEAKQDEVGQKAHSSKDNAIAAAPAAAAGGSSSSTSD
jgi:hypothetical protein